MAKRIILISSFPLLVALAIIALVLAGVGRGQPAVSKVELPASTPADNDANAAVDKLIADYADNANSASTLVGTAGQCTWDRNYDGAQRLYRAVIDNHPNKRFVFYEYFLSL